MRENDCPKLNELIRLKDIMKVKDKDFEFLIKRLCNNIYVIKKTKDAERLAKQYKNILISCNEGSI